MSDASDEGGANAPRHESPAGVHDQADAVEHSTRGASGTTAADSGDRKSDTGRWVLQIRLAAAFLTILPVGPAEAASPADVAASFGWFPLVGFGIGIGLFIVDWMLSPIFGHAMRAVLIVLLLTVVTGGLHLDGVADTADALGARSDRNRALEILRDSHIGSFGTLALIFIISLKALAIAGAGGGHRHAAIYMAPGLGRWAMVAIASSLDYLRAEGAGAAMLSRDRRRNLKIATITAVVMLAPLVMFHALRACVIAAVATLAMRSFYRRWMGGVTGDLIGAAGEIVETAVLIAIAS
jgi:adenosylcobinamide-GDP ribazoletransferase